MSCASSICRKTSLPLVLAFLPAVASPAAAVAQPGPQGELTDPDMIVITARKREEALAKAAAPVSVVTGRQLIETGTNSTARLNERFPALTVEPTATGNLIFIRGVGNFTLQPNSDPAVGFVYDGVSISRPMGTLSQFFDLDRVELLKGPQGVLYGRNASAGTINLEPRQPVLGESSISADVSAASYADLTAETAINLPVGRTAAIRISAAASSQDAFLRGYRTGPNQQSVRTQLKMRIGERTTLRLSGD